MRISKASDHKIVKHGDGFALVSGEGRVVYELAFSSAVVEFKPGDIVWVNASFVALEPEVTYE